MMRGAGAVIRLPFSKVEKDTVNPRYRALFTINFDNQKEP